MRRFAVLFMLFAGAATVTAVAVMRDTSESPACMAAVIATPRAPQLDRVEALARVAEAFAQLTAEYEKSDDVALRETILGALARRGDAESVRWLASTAASEDRLAKHAARALARVVKSEAAPALEEVIASDAPVMVRSAAIRALAHAGSRTNAGTLARIAGSAQQPLELRQDAVLALAGTAKDVSAIPVLVGTLDDPSEQLRIAAIRALAATRNPDGRIALERHASRTLTRNERVWLDRALGKL